MSAHMKHRLRTGFFTALFISLALVMPGAVSADLLLPPLEDQGIAPYYKGYSTPPATINVLISRSYSDPWPTGWLNSWRTVPMDGTSVQAYVPGVVMGELGTVSFSNNPNWPFQGWAWHDEVVKAFSIMARTFGSYKARYLSDPSGQGGLDNSDTYQSYRPYYNGMAESTKQRYRNLSSIYNGLYLAYNDRRPVGNFDHRYKVNLLDAEYNNDAPNPTVSGWNVAEGTGYGYLPSVTNPFASGDSPAPARFGAVQLGLQGWTAIGSGVPTFWQLLSHYYSHSQLVYSKPYWNVAYYDTFNSTGCVGSQVWGIGSKWINYDWNTSSLGIAADAPDASSPIPADDICMHFVTSDTFANGWYTFYLVADDGVKLLIDGVEVFSAWHDQAPTMYTVNVPMTAGTHTITLKYYERLGRAVARLTWRQYNGMLGKYYDNVPVKGNEPPRDQIVMERFDPTVSFAWDLYSPLDTRESVRPYPRIDANSFAAIWQTSIYIPQASTCRSVSFTAVTDDGLLVTINGNVVLDKWFDQPPTTYTIASCFWPGTYLLKVYYYESTGGATARFTW